MHRVEKKKKVLVALSGGVDSSVSAALLQEQGYDVTGAFIKVWHPDFLSCTWREDREDAMRVCAHLGIAFSTFDFEEAYKREVVDYMIESYKKGLTPNPDVMCNKVIKFGAFFDRAMKEGADTVATGHYAQIVPKKDLHSTRYLLHSSLDKEKDQTYFLWTLTQNILSKTLFPVGGLQKSEVREHAKRFGLLTADKKDSQGLCFIGEVNVRDFLKRFIESKKGAVLDEQGEEIGWHEQASYFTLGQRHGFTITKKTPDDPPYYIVAKDVERNTVTVSHNKKPRTPVQSVSLRACNWIAGELPDTHSAYTARFRYRQPLQPCTITRADTNTADIAFETPQEAIAPGQSLVVYDKEECIGGGIIR